MYIISISILPGNILDYEENRHRRQKRDHMDIHRMIAHSHRDIQSKTEKLVRNAAKVGQQRQNKNNAKQHCQTADPVKLGEQDIEDVTEFTYLGAKVTKDGNTESEIKTRISKAKWSICGSEEHLEDENDQQENKDTHFQEQHTERTTICCRVLESDQRNMPHAGRIPKQVPQKNSAHLLAKQDNQCRAPRPNWDAARLVRSKEEKMEVDWPRKHNATGIYSKNSHALEPRRKQEEGTTKRDVEKVRGARDESSRVELGPGRKAGSGQNTMAFLRVGLMCEHARRGLSK